MRHKPFEELDLFLCVLPLIGHQLHHADDRALVLDGNHHRRLRGRRSSIGDLPQRPVRIEVVELAFAFTDLPWNVVEQKRLAADDHTALHAATGAVQRQRRQRRRIDLVALVPHVLAPNEIVDFVIRRNEETIVWNHRRE